MTDAISSWQENRQRPYYTRSWEIGKYAVTAIVEWRIGKWEWRTSVYRQNGLGRNCIDGSAGYCQTPEQAAWEAGEWVKANVKEKTR